MSIVHFDILCQFFLCFTKGEVKGTSVELLIMGTTQQEVFMCRPLRNEWQCFASACIHGPHSSHRRTS